MQPISPAQLLSVSSAALQTQSGHRSNPVRSSRCTDSVLVLVADGRIACQMLVLAVTSESLSCWRAIDVVLLREAESLANPQISST